MEAELDRLFAELNRLKWNIKLLDERTMRGEDISDEMIDLQEYYIDRTIQVTDAIEEITGQPLNPWPEVQEIDESGPDFI